LELNYNPLTSIPDTILNIPQFKILAIYNYPFYNRFINSKTARILKERGFYVGKEGTPELSSLREQVDVSYEVDIRDNFPILS
jgi:hypothetical protein